MRPANKKETHFVPTQIKDKDLVERRRKEIVDAAVPLLFKQGFHKTTTRQLARAAGFSIGTLYEYVSCKEDVLYLVCETIHDEVEKGIAEALAQPAEGKQALAAIIRAFFLICHNMSDFILLIYQETHALPEQWREKVLDNELRINDLFVEALQRIATTGETDKLDDRAIDLLAHNISILGHMWTFRRWTLSRNYGINEYIERQTNYILNMAGIK
ncbi:MAG: TetR/AcrR family transcriptional regulator [Deltaproteobacteria bacterium]|nr:TetR/AcrR family transcriptional regulator [Deltaproteobacteria bacterium]